MERGAHNRQFLDDRREAEQRGPRDLDAQMAEVHEGLLRVAIGEMQLVEIEPQGDKG